MVVALRRPDQHAEVVVPDRERPADAGDGEEDPDHGVAGLRAVTAMIRPVAGGAEGIRGEGEDREGNRESYAGLDRPGHIGAAPWNDGG